MSPQSFPATPNHLKQRYSVRKVCEIFGVCEKTLRRWMREGVPLATGQRAPLRFIWFGPRKTEFEKEEIERVYNEIKAASDEAIRNGTLPFADEGEGEAEWQERRELGRRRAVPPKRRAPSPAKRPKAA